MLRVSENCVSINAWTLVSGIFLLLAGCNPAHQQAPIPAEKEVTMNIQISSPAFKEGQPIPVQFTCEGQDISPPLQWGDVPPGTKSLALIADDPDAPVGTWVHWVLYDLPPQTRSLPQAVPSTDTIEGGAKQGRNDFGKIGYGGPCPPPGKAHRYYFKVHALDTALALKPGPTKQELLRAMAGHTLAAGQLMGMYQRR